MPDKISLKLRLILYGLLLAPFALRAQDPPVRGEYADSSLVVLDPWLYSYESVEKAAAADPGSSGRFLLLAGGWKAHFSRGKQDQPAGFHLPSFNDSAWEPSAFPGAGNPEASGGAGGTARAAAPGGASRSGKDQESGRETPVRDGEKEAFRPAGLYRKSIVLPENWAGRQVYLAAPAKRAAAQIWVNGRQVEQSGSGELDITGYLQPGGNLLAIEIPAPGRAVEAASPSAGNGSSVPEAAARDPLCRSAVFPGGLFLYARPRVHIRDVAITARPEQGENGGQLGLKVRVESFNDSLKRRFWGVLKEPVYSTASVKAKLFDPEGQEVLSLDKEHVRQIRGGTGVSFDLKGSVREIRAWSEETPALYRLNILLLNGTGQVLEALSGTVGFREADLGEGELAVNGKKVRLKLFRPREYPRLYPEGGREAMLSQVRFIKQGHFNAVNAGDYPEDPYWYQLCDRYGLYVIGEPTRLNKNRPSLIASGREEPVLKAAPREEKTVSREEKSASRQGTDVSDKGGGAPGKEPAVPAGDPVISAETPAAPPAALREGSYLKYYQAMHAQQNVEVRLVDFLKGTVSIRNGYAFRDLSGHYLQWEVLENGRKIDEGRSGELHTGAGKTEILRLGTHQRFRQGREYFLNLFIRTGAATEMLPQGFNVASEQFRLGPYRYEYSYQPDKGLITATDQFSSIELEGYDFHLSFDKTSGQISRYIYRGKELAVAGPRLHFPGPVDADPGGTDPGGVDPGDADENSQRDRQEMHAFWVKALENSRVIDYQVTEDVNGNYYIAFTSELLGGDARFFQKFRVDGKGAILVENIFVKLEGQHSGLPGFGTCMELPSAYRKMEWYGQESSHSEAVGIYSEGMTAGENRQIENVRWITLLRSDGYGIQLRPEGEHLLGITLSPGEGKKGGMLLGTDLPGIVFPYQSYDFTYRIIPIAATNM